MSELAIKAYSQYSRISASIFGWLQPSASLVGRVYVAWVFFASGLTKIKDWDSTLMLFEYEYSVPMLNFEVAAYLATAGELILPVLLILGLFSRISALGISIINIVAVISLEDMAMAALYAHVIWGLLLLHVVLWGAGRMSGDAALKRYLSRDRF